MINRIILREVGQLEAKVSKIIDQKILDWFTAQAKVSPCLRLNWGRCYCPTDRESSFEEVSDLRGQGVRRVLMEHIIG